MENLTIRPLLRFMNSLQRDYMTRGDWDQLEQKLKNQLADKASRQQPTAIDEAYLAILQQARAECAAPEQNPLTRKLFPASTRL